VIAGTALLPRAFTLRARRRAGIFAVPTRHRRASADRIAPLMTRTLDLATAATHAATHAAAHAAGARGDAPPAADQSRRRPCREVCARVFEFLDGELPPELAAAVRAHLAACGSCRRRVAGDGALLAVVARAARAIEGSAPLSLRARIHRALRCAELAGGGGARHDQPPPPPPPPAAPPATRSRRPA